MCYCLAAQCWLPPPAWVPRGSLRESGISRPAWFETQLAVVISGVGFAAQFVFFVYSAVFQATQRFDLANVIGIGTRLANAAMTVALLKAGYGLPALAAATSATSLLDYGLRVPVARRILPQMKLRWGLVRSGLWRQFATFGVASLLTQGGTRLITYSDAMVIGLFMPVAAIAPFSLAAGLVGQFAGLFGPIGWVLCPTLTSFDAADDRQGLHGVLISAARWMALVVVITAVVTGLLARDFFDLWVGAASLGIQSVRFGDDAVPHPPCRRRRERVTEGDRAGVLRGHSSKSARFAGSARGGQQPRPERGVHPVLWPDRCGARDHAPRHRVQCGHRAGNCLPPGRHLHGGVRQAHGGSTHGGSGLPVSESGGRFRISIGSPSWLSFFGKSLVVVIAGVGVATTIGMSRQDRGHALQIAREIASRFAGRVPEASGGRRAGGVVE